MNFLISWFIVVMQALWRTVEDIVGKGIDGFVFFKFLFYAAVTFIPLALILGILLASLMTFGNLGEKLELLAIKSAGIPLYKVMKPIFVTVMGLAIGLYFFQNDWMIKSQVKFYTLYFSMSNKSPELEIPEGVFYTNVRGMSIYVKEKDNKNKILKDVMIYDYSQGYANARIILSDSARIFSVPNSNKVIFRLFSGESFENLEHQNYSTPDRLVPYRRETFSRKDLVTKYDSQMNMLDQDIISSQFVGKNIHELGHYTDSLGLKVDSMETRMAATFLNSSYLTYMNSTPTVKTPVDVWKDEPASASKNETGIEDSSQSSKRKNIQKVEELEDEDKEEEKPKEIVLTNPENKFAKLPKSERVHYDIYRIFNNAGYDKQSDLTRIAKESLENRKSMATFEQSVLEDQSRVLRRNLIEWHKKLTFPVACIIFFFIGAPLGSIIRKGGLGTPLVTAVLFFIFYYLLDSLGYRMSRDGVWEVWFGTWLPAIILTPIGIWLSYIATKDSTKLNIDSYLLLVKKFFGTSTSRKVEFKEVSMVNVDYDKAMDMLNNILIEADRELQSKKLHYHQFFLDQEYFNRRNRLVYNIEECVDYLSNSRQVLLVSKLADVPQLSVLTNVVRPSKKWLSYPLMILFPLGLILYFNYLYRDHELRKNLETLKIVVRDLKELSLNGDKNVSSTGAMVSELRTQPI